MSLNLFFIASVVVLLPILMAIGLARAMALLDTAVADVSTSLEQEKTAYNPRMTLGHKISVAANVDEQLKEARRLAAKQAAQLPRGANMRIGPKDHVATKTAHDGVGEDPLTAVRIAAFHGWQGALQGAHVAQQAGPVARTGGQAAAPQVKRELKPGVDYEYTEITPDMDPAEVRRVRIANVKAKAAALKAQKAALGGAPAFEAAPAAAPQQEQAAPAPANDGAAAAAATGIPEPQLIEITDDMAPADVRQARIANAKAQAEYKKALKAAGVDLSAGAAPAATSASPQAATPAEPTPATQQAPAAVPANIPPPQLIEITDDMDPADVRQARIANAKAQAEYKKALKAAGIDPSTVG